MSPLWLSAGRMALIKIYGVNGVKDPKGLISEYAETRGNYSLLRRNHTPTRWSDPDHWECGQGCSKEREVMALLLDRRGDQIQITEDIVKAAASNWKMGKRWWHCCWIDEVIRSRSLRMWSRLQQTIGRDGKEVMALLLDRQDDQIHRRWHSSPIEFKRQFPK